MTNAPPPSAAERLLALLPQIFRIRDHEQADSIAAAQGFAPSDPLADVAEGPLATLLAALGQQFDLLEAEVDWLYEDQFIETCADWVVPYIGALVGARIVDVGEAQSARLQVADTIRNRRGKGTARVIANRAHDVFVAPAEAIEYGGHVAATLNPNFPGDRRAMTAGINGAAGRALALPTTIGQHVAELRSMSEGGRFAPAYIGARVWTTRGIEHAEVVPAAVSGGEPGRFRFDPLGRDIALWSLPDDYVADRSRLTIGQVPGPIPLIAAVDRPEDYYGPGQSLAISIAGVAQPLAEICFCDLADDGGPGQWNHRGSPTERARIRIDPRRGRFVLPGGGAGVVPSSIRVRYHFGSALTIGGAPRALVTAAGEQALRSLLGARDRRPEVPIDFTAPSTLPETAEPAEVAGLFAQTLDDLGNGSALSLAYGGTIAAPGATTLPQGADMEVRGGDGVWPTILLGGSWTLSGGNGSTLTLRGLRLAGDELIVAADGLRQLALIDCTFAPGSGAIVIEEPGCKLLAVRSILGSIRVAPSVEIDLVDCVVDSGGADTAAITALGGGAGGVLWGERSTIIGDIDLLSFDEVSNALFATRPERTLATVPASAARLQSGCVRYSALPRGARVPRRYRCFPAEGDIASPAPVFASLVYGDAPYATLVAANPAPLLTGAENGGEMGVGNATSYHRRKRLLDRDLIDWVPFGMTAATEMSD